LPVFSNSVSTSSKTVPQFRNPEGYHKSEKKICSPSTIRIGDTSSGDN